MRLHSMDLRKRVAEACDARAGTREKIAERFAVGVSWLRRLPQQRRKAGSIAPWPPDAGRKLRLNGRQMEKRQEAAEHRRRRLGPAPYVR